MGGQATRGRRSHLYKLRQIKNIEVGLHPGAMALSPDKSRLYVARANSDIISVIDTKSDAVVGTISVRMEKDLPFGSAPNALAISPDAFCFNHLPDPCCFIFVRINPCWSLLFYSSGS